MGTCVVCKNEYDKAFEIRPAGSDEALTFDSFECAIHRLAPTCAHCDCRIIGHGIEADEQMYCCANCAHHAGVTAARDRVDEAPSDAPPAAPV